MIRMSKFAEQRVHDCECPFGCFLIIVIVIASTAWQIRTVSPSVMVRSAETPSRPRCFFSAVPNSVLGMISLSFLGSLFLADSVSCWRQYVASAAVSK